VTESRGARLELVLSSVEGGAPALRKSFPARLPNAPGEFVKQSQGEGDSPPNHPECKGDCPRSTPAAEFIHKLGDRVPPLNARRSRSPYYGKIACYLRLTLKRHLLWM